MVLSEAKRPGTPPSSVAYFKYYLRDFLRRDGSIDISRLSRDLTRSRSSGQQLAFRLMVFSAEEGGEIVRAAGIRDGMNYHYDDGHLRGKTHWVPDFENEKLLALLNRILRTLGRKFDGHPHVSHVDIGYVGLWGEWQTSDTHPKVPMPSFEVQKRIIDMHFDAFPRTRKLMQLQEPQALRYALDRGAGMRADCLADSSAPMMTLYPITLSTAGAQNAWQHAPVVFEICWTLKHWGKLNWDPGVILQTALDTYHATALNTKSSHIPRAFRPMFDYFLRKAGYRLSLSEIAYPESVPRTSEFVMHTSWENTGVAPCYGDFRILLRLKGKSGKSKILRSDQQLCGRLPGAFAIDIPVSGLSDLPAGAYGLSLGVAQGNARSPTIYLANAGRKRRWHSLGAIALH